MRLLDLLLGARHEPLSATFNGSHLFTMHQQFPNGDEANLTDYVDFVQGGYHDNGVVFGCILARMLALAEVEFKWQRIASRELFGDPRLRLLEQPWVNGSTGELIARMEQDASLAGNAYLLRDGQTLRRLRPDWVTIIRVERDGLHELAGYAYLPGGEGSGEKPRIYPPDNVVHWSPIPDPMAEFRGMSWLTPVAREIVGDKAMSAHRNKFFQNAATPNIVVATKEALTSEQRETFVEQLRQRHGGLDNAYKTMLIDGGADVTVVGNSFEQMNFATVQAAGENRIAVAAGVPSIIVGLKEGLQSATYSNYQQAVRRFVDGTLRPLWRSLASALGSVLDAPDGTRLWYDDRHIALLHEDAKDAAEILAKKASTIRTLTDGGFAAESVVAAVDTGDLTKLVHTGLLSVQMQPPGSENPAPASGDA